MNIVMQYGGPVLAGIIVALIYKAYFAAQIQGKIKRYQAEIVKSHAKILDLEGRNDKLEKKLKEVDTSFIKDKLVMN